MLKKKWSDACIILSKGQAHKAGNNARVIIKNPVF